ncbi:MAG: hypothetical protein ACREV4_14750 [Gammaproteobacteria bacterium]
MRKLNHASEARDPKIHSTEVTMKLSKTLIPALVLLAGTGWAMAEEESVETLPRFSQVDNGPKTVGSPRPRPSKCLA